MKMSRLLLGPVGCPRSRQDFLYFCLFGRKTSLQIRLQKMKPVISPENFAVHYETRNSKYSGLNGTLRLKTKPLLDFVGVGLAQQLPPVEAQGIGNLMNNAIRGDVSSLTPRRIEKPHGKSRPLSSGRAARCRWRAASAVSSSSRQTNTGRRGRSLLLDLFNPHSAQSGRSDGVFEFVDQAVDDGLAHSS